MLISRRARSWWVNENMKTLSSMNLIKLTVDLLRRSPGPECHRQGSGRRAASLQPVHGHRGSHRGRRSDEEGPHLPPPRDEEGNAARAPGCDKEGDCFGSAEVARSAAESARVIGRKENDTQLRGKKGGL